MLRRRGLPKRGEGGLALFLTWYFDNDRNRCGDETMTANDLPVAIIGAGPIGLAAAAHLVERGVPVRIYETGPTVGANIRDWAHVRIFTTWEQSVDTASRRLLEASAWRLPDPNGLPTGEDIYRHYLKPLSRHPALSSHIQTNARVVRVSRLGLDKTSSK